MKPLPLGADSNLEFAGAVAILLALWLPICALLVIEVRKIVLLRRQRRKGLASFEHFDERAGQLVRSGFRMVLWAVLAVLGLAALLIFPIEGFIGVQYDSEHVQLDYRFQKQPVSITWAEVTSVRLFETKPTARRYRISSHIEIARQGGVVYKSVAASGKDKRGLLAKAAQELVDAKRHHDRQR